jgi:hypothetical protein
MRAGRQVLALSIGEDGDDKLLLAINQRGQRVAGTDMASLGSFDR